MKTTMRTPYLSLLIGAVISLLMLSCGDEPKNAETPELTKEEAAKIELQTMELEIEVEHARELNRRLEEQMENL